MKYVGVDIGGTNLKAGLVDESGTLLATQKMKVASIVDREGLAWTVASLVQELAKAANIPVSDVASVGVGVPGTVDIRAGSIAYTCNLPLRDVPLRAGVLITCITRRGKTIIPDGAAHFEKGDTVVAVTACEEAVTHMNDLFEP